MLRRNKQLSVSLIMNIGFLMSHNENVYVRRK